MIFFHIYVQYLYTNFLWHIPSVIRNICKISAKSTGSSIRYTALKLVTSCYWKVKFARAPGFAIYHDFKPLYNALFVDFNHQISWEACICTHILTGQKQVKSMRSSWLGKSMKLNFATWSVSLIWRSGASYWQRLTMPKTTVAQRCEQAAKFNFMDLPYHDKRIDFTCFWPVCIWVQMHASQEIWWSKSTNNALYRGLKSWKSRAQTWLFSTRRLPTSALYSE